MKANDEIIEEIEEELYSKNIDKIRIMILVCNLKVQTYIEATDKAIKIITGKINEEI